MRNLKKHLLLPLLVLTFGMQASPALGLLKSKRAAKPDPIASASSTEYENKDPSEYYDKAQKQLEEDFLSGKVSTVEEWERRDKELSEGRKKAEKAHRAGTCNCERQKVSPSTGLFGRIVHQLFGKKPPSSPLEHRNEVLKEASANFEAANHTLNTFDAKIPEYIRAFDSAKASINQGNQLDAQATVLKAFQLSDELQYHAEKANYHLDTAQDACKTAVGEPFADVPFSTLFESSGCRTRKYSLQSVRSKKTLADDYAQQVATLVATYNKKFPSNKLIVTPHLPSSEEPSPLLAVPGAVQSPASREEATAGTSQITPTPLPEAAAVNDASPTSLPPLAGSAKPKGSASLREQARLAIGDVKAAGNKVLNKVADLTKKTKEKFTKSQQEATPSAQPREKPKLPVSNLQQAQSDVKEGQTALPAKEKAALLLKRAKQQLETVGQKLSKTTEELAKGAKKRGTDQEQPKELTEKLKQSPTSPVAPLPPAIARPQETAINRTAKRVQIAAVTGIPPVPLLRSISATSQVGATRTKQELPKPAEYKLSKGPGKIKIIQAGKLQAKSTVGDGRCFFNSISLALASEKARLGKDFPKELEAFVTQPGTSQTEGADKFIKAIGEKFKDRYGLDLLSEGTQAVTLDSLKDTLLRGSGSSAEDPQQQFKTILSAAKLLAEFSKAIFNTAMPGQEKISLITNLENEVNHAQLRRNDDNNRAIMHTLLFEMQSALNNGELKSEANKFINNFRWTGIGKSGSLSDPEVFRKQGLQNKDQNSMQQIMKDFFNIDITIVNKAIPESDHNLFVLAEPDSTSPAPVHVFVQYDGKFTGSTFSGQHFSALVPQR